MKDSFKKGYFSNFLHCVAAFGFVKLQTFHRRAQSKQNKMKKIEEVYAVGGVV